MKDDSDTLLPSETRIKRHVWGPELELGIFVDKDLIRATEVELQAMGYTKWNSEDWGISLKGRMKDVYRFNTGLSSVSRIVIRILHLKAGAREQLFKRVRNFAWELWLPWNGKVPELDIRIHMAGSLVHHEGLAEKAIRDGIQSRLRQVYSSGDNDTTGDPMNQRIYAHMSGSQVTLSIDTTGEHLHRRGYRLNPGTAPLAEHKAAALVKIMESSTERPQWILDAMAGSGTLGFEAALGLSGISPGLGRHFVYQDWPSYRAQTHHYCLRTPVREDKLQGVVQTAVDISPKSREAWNDNYKNFSAVYGLVLSEVQAADVFSLNPEGLGFSGPGWILLNPPYDYRLSQSMDEVYRKITRWLIEQWTNKNVDVSVLVIVPHQRLLPLFESFPRFMKDFSFNHGGMKVQVLGIKPGEN